MVDQRQQDGTEEKRVGHRKNEIKMKKLMISYTNIDGLLSKRLELMDYLSEKKPDIMCIVETKLEKDTDLMIHGKLDYNIWRNDRRGGKGGGIIILTKQTIKVAEVKYETEYSENISIQIEVANNKRINVIATYVPPKTRCWNDERYKNMINRTVDFLDNEIPNNKKVIITGDFNCKEVDWENFETEGGEDSWGNRLLRLATNKLLTQWVREDTRIRGNDEPSRLDLVFTKDINLEQSIRHEPPLGKSDHEVLEFSVIVEEEDRRKETHKRNRQNYAKANYEGLRRFFHELNWAEMYGCADVQRKYDIFVNKYNR